ncbi:MAG: tetratricopeptide repeat protein [Acidobacteriota bacterium]
MTPRPLAWLRLGALGLLPWITLGCGSEPAESLASEVPEAVGFATPEAREALLEEIEALSRDGRYDEALVKTRQGLEQAPRDALLHFHLGLQLQSTGDFTGAEKALQRTIELQPGHYPSYRVLGDLARQRGQPEIAVDYFERCVAGLPEHAGCRFGLALAWIDLGEPETAAAPLEAAAEQLDRADVWSELGRLERRRRRPAAAVDAFARALDCQPHHLPSLLGMGQALIAAGRRTEGQALLDHHRQEAAIEDRLKALQRAAQQPDSPVEVHLKLASLYRSRADAQAEEAALREALAKAPGFQPAILALANQRRHQGDLTEAEQWVSELGPEMAAEPAVRFLRGTLAIGRGDEDAALNHFEASRADGDWPPPVYLDAGEAWLEAGIYDRAKAAFRRASERLPESSVAWIGLAESALRSGALQQVEGPLRRALAIDPDASRAWLLLGAWQAERGHADAGGQAFRRYLEIRQLDLLTPRGRQQTRRVLQNLAPSPSVLERFEQSFEHSLAQSPSQSQK